jgi:hypothetical protein
LTGKEEYKAMVKSLIEGADIVLIFFSVVDPVTFNNALEHVKILECSGSRKSVLQTPRP